MAKVRSTKRKTRSRHSVTHEMDIPNNASTNSNVAVSRLSNFCENTEPSRFFELPAEVRINIYELVTKEDRNISLRDLKPPAITRASRQCRNEALTVFFSVNDFTVSVRGSYTQWEPAWGGYRGRTLERGQFVMEDDRRYKLAGTLCLKRQVKSLLQNYDPDTVRLQTLRIVIMDCRSDNLPSGVTIFLGHNGPGKQPTVTRRMAESSCNWLSRASFQDQEHLSSPATAFLEDVTSRTDYKGLSISDLNNLAATLRVAPGRGMVSAPVMPENKKRAPRGARIN